MDSFIDGAHLVADLQFRIEENAGDVKDEQATVRVLAGGLTLVGDSNKSKKNYSRFAMTSNDILFNVPAMK